MKLFRGNLSPLASDSVSSLNLPRVRMGLLTKLNLLTVGLIFLTAISTAGYYLWQQWRDENLELHRRGSAARPLSRCDADGQRNQGGGDPGDRHSCGTHEVSPMISLMEQLASAELM